MVGSEKWKSAFRKSDLFFCDSFQRQRPILPFHEMRVPGLDELLIYERSRWNEGAKVCERWDLLLLLAVASTPSGAFTIFANFPNFHATEIFQTLNFALLVFFAFRFPYYFPFLFSFSPYMAHRHFDTEKFISTKERNFQFERSQVMPHKVTQHFIAGLHRDA